MKNENTQIRTTIGIEMSNIHARDHNTRSRRLALIVRQTDTGEIPNS